MGEVVGGRERGADGQPHGAGRDRALRGGRQVQLVGQQPRGRLGAGAVFDAAVLGLVGQSWRCPG